MADTHDEVSEGRAVRVFGLSLIALIWIASGLVALVLVALLFLQVEGRYLLTEDRSDEVVVIRLDSASSTTGGDALALSYTILFPSGEHRSVSFPSTATFRPGDRILLRYARTRLLREIVVRDFAKVQDPAR